MVPHPALGWSRLPRGRGELDATRSRPGRNLTKGARRQGVGGGGGGNKRHTFSVTRVRCSVRRAQPQQTPTTLLAGRAGTASFPAAQLRLQEAGTGALASWLRWGSMQAWRLWRPHVDDKRGGGMFCRHTQVTMEQVGFPARMLLSSNTSHPSSAHSSSNVDHTVTPTVITSCPAGFKLQYQRVSCKISQVCAYSLHTFRPPVLSASLGVVSRSILLVLSVADWLSLPLYPSPSTRTTNTST